MVPPANSSGSEFLFFARVVARSLTAWLISRTVLVSAALITGGDEPFRQGDGHAEIDVLELDDGVAVEGRVDRGDRRGGADNGFQDEVVHRVFVARGLFRLLVDVRAEGHERRGVDFHLQIEMRNLRLRGEETLRDDVAHAGERDALVVGTGDGTDRLDGLGPGAGSASRGCGFHVGNEQFVRQGQSR